jgi:F-type H+-transporting ATPase subunit b
VLDSPAFDSSHFLGEKMIFGLVIAESSIQLVPDGSIFVHIILILIMVVVLNRTLFKPVNALLAERERIGLSSVSEARKIQETIERELSVYESSLRSARAEGYRLAEEQRVQELHARRERLDLASSDLGRLIEAEKQAIQENAIKIQQGLEEKSAEVASAISNQILGS